MAINLLPSEEKAKIKSEKQAAVPVITMTGPAQAEKKPHPVTKGGGVLGFFKQAFQSPKRKTDEEEKVASDKKIIVEEKIVFERPKERVKPIIEFTKPVHPPAKKLTPSAAHKPGWLMRLLGKRSDKPIKIEERISLSPKTPSDSFPKFHPVKAEKVIPQFSVKPRRPEVISVTTREWHEPKKSSSLSSFTTPARPTAVPSVFPSKKIIAQPQRDAVTATAQPKKPSAEKQHGPSVWQRLTHWLKNVFVRQPKMEKNHIQMTTAPAMPPRQALPGDFTVQKKMTPLATSALPPSTSEKPKPPLAQKSPVMHVPPPPTPSPSMQVAHGLPTVSSSDKSPVEEVELSEPVPSSPSKIKKDFLKFTRPVEPVTKIGGMDWDVNLVPEEALEHEIPLSKIMYIALAAVISCAFVLGAWLALNWTYTKKVEEVGEISNQIAEKDTLIKGYKQLETNVQSLKTRIDDIKILLEKHIYWSKLFSKVEQYTIQNVYLTGMTADVNGSVSLSASAENYESAVKQLYVLQQATDFVKNVSISGITLGSGTSSASSSRTAGITTAVVDPTVTFTITMSVLPSIFYQTP